MKAACARPTELALYGAYHAVYSGPGKGLHDLLFRPYVESLELLLRDRDDDYILV